MDFQNLIFEVKGRVAVITMNREKALNALNDDTFKEFNAALDLVQNDSNIKGAIITGNGKAFVAGADILQVANNDSEAARAYFELAQNTFNRIENMGKPFIAAVNGFALGGGCELAMACDIRIASEKALFGQPEVNIGVVASFGGTKRLPRLVGVGIAKELMLTARNVRAEEALRIGLVNKVVTPESLMEETLAMMNVIVSKPGIAIRYTKIAINKGLDLDINSALELEKDFGALTYATEDQKEGMRAFLEKRPPNFKY